MTTQTSIRVLIADDHAVVREGLRALIEAKPDMELIGEAEDGVQAVLLARSLKPDVILLDLMMPRMDGFDFVRELRLRPEWRAVPVVVVTAKELTDEDRSRLQGLVSRVIQKGALTRDDLLAEVRAVAGRAGKKNRE